MNEKQTVEIVTTICMSYPSFERLGAEAVKGMVKIWAMLFADDDYGLVQLAVAKHISTSKWPPSVSEIREQMMKITHPELIPPDQAWAAVKDAMYGLGEFTSQEKLDEVLPPLIATAVKTIGMSKLWQAHDPCGRGYKAFADKQLFYDIYRPAYERECERLMLPKRIASKIPTSDSFLEPARRVREDRENLLNSFINDGLYDEIEAPTDTKLLEE